MFRDFAFAANGFVLLCIFVFSLFLVLYKSPADQSDVYKHDVIRIVYGLSAQPHAQVHMSDDIYKQLLSDSLNIVSYTPYDRQSWIFLAALMDANEGRFVIPASGFDPAIKAGIARSLRSEAAERVDGEIKAMARSFYPTPNNTETEVSK